MKCEDFETFGLDAERDSSVNELERAAARQHAGSCSRCASLQDSWQAGHLELRSLAADTQAVSAPPRVEMRLRQEFRMQKRTMKTERAAAIAIWVLATAAVLVGAVSWHNWNAMKREETAKRLVTPVDSNASRNVRAGNGTSNSSDLNADDRLVADSDGSGFTFLPGTFSADTEDAAIMQVRLQRSALGAMGLPVDQDTASDWVQVDLLVGNDGQPQAVRLPQQ